MRKATRGERLIARVNLSTAFAVPHSTHDRAATGRNLPDRKPSSDLRDLRGLSDCSAFMDEHSTAHACMLRAVRSAAHCYSNGRHGHDGLPRAPQHTPSTNTRKVDARAAAATQKGSAALLAARAVAEPLDAEAER